MRRVRIPRTIPSTRRRRSNFAAIRPVPSAFLVPVSPLGSPADRSSLSERLVAAVTPPHPGGGPRPRPGLPLRWGERSGVRQVQQHPQVGGWLDLLTASHGDLPNPGQVDPTAGASHIDREHRLAGPIADLNHHHAVVPLLHGPDVQCVWRYVIKLSDG